MRDWFDGSLLGLLDMHNTRLSEVVVGCWLLITDNRSLFKAQSAIKPLKKRPYSSGVWSWINPK